MDRAPNINFLLADKINIKHQERQRKTGMCNLSPALGARLIKVGMIGTGYAAKLRAEAFLKDTRTDLVAVVGNTTQKTKAFAQQYNCEVINRWKELIERQDVDLIVASTVNQHHGDIALAALSAGKHIIVEYPLCLDVAQGSEIIALAKTQNKLLHVGHIEVLGGLHSSLKEKLPQLGEVFYTSYRTIKPQNSIPLRWSYNHELFGFPLMGALSRIYRLVDLFGGVKTVNCHNRFMNEYDKYYQSCICTAQIGFENGILAEIIYGKGKSLWQRERKFEVHGENGALIFEGTRGILLRNGETISIELPSRKGLFSKDTNMVLEHLFEGAPLYITPEQSLYALKVAEAARKSADTGLTVTIK